MITRKLGSLFRGKATPFQIVAACVLGALLGFAPDVLQAPGLYGLLVAALLVVNANLGLALLVAAIARLLSFVAAPVSFEIGRVLLDGPTTGLAQTIVNAPFLAWCGFEYYAVAGGQALGLVLGTVAGIAFSRAVRSFRLRRAAAENDPSRFAAMASKPWARFMIWLFFGGKGKQSWEDKAAKRVGNPVRIWGAALLLLLVAGGYFAQRALGGPLARRGLTAGLEGVNGATVDVGAVTLDLEEGRLEIDGLALADPEALATDLFRAARLEADLDQTDLLRRQVHIARIVISDARSGAPRATPGERTRPAPVEEEDASTDAGLGMGGVSLEEVFEQYDVWKERLGQAQEWLERLAGEASDEEEAGEDEESLADRLARRAREQGWFSVDAEHLVEDAPTLLLSELVVDSLQVDAIPGRTFDLRGSALSTHPALVDAPPRVELVSRDGAIGFEVDLAPASRGGGDGALRFHWKGLALDDAMAQLKLSGAPPFQGGTIDLELGGAWDKGRIGRLNLPLRVTVRDTIFTYKGVEPTRIDELPLTIGISGSLDAPRIHFDASALTDALVAAGKKELANQVRSRISGEVGEKLDELAEGAGIEVPDDVGDALQDAAKDALGGLFGGKKKD